MRLRLRTAALALLLMATAPAASASAQGPPQTVPAEPGPGLTTPCGGRAITPDKVITGEFGVNINKTYVMLPFDVPAGTTAVRVKYCWDKPEGGTSSHTLDLGLYGPRPGNQGIWGEPEFRGWGGSSHPDVTLSSEGFSTEAQYTANPRVEVPGKTARGFIPGPIKPGQWAAELGVAAVIPQSEGDADGKVRWRVEIDLANDPSFNDEPYQPAPYNTAPARAHAGWYAGDMHVHAEHSAYGNAPMSEVFGYAFKPIAQGGAGLDFITLSDYVSGYPAWNEIGRYQAQYRRNLVVRSSEVITYHGHTNNHGSAHFVDYRTVPIYERLADGSLKLQSPGRLPSDIFKEVHRFGGWTQINHPTIFPPVTPAAAAFCRGCFWEYSDADTDYSQVDALEVATGVSHLGATTPNPFTGTAITLYERLLGLGYKIAAVGSSDSHLAGRHPGALDAPVGEATTVVRAPELSEDGIRCGVQARHTYVKVTGNAGPDLRFNARPWGHREQRAILGDVVDAPGATFHARVLNGSGANLRVVKDGTTVATVPITGANFKYRFDGSGPGRWRLQIMSGNLIDTVSSPIWLRAGRKGVEHVRCRGVRGHDWYS